MNFVPSPPTPLLERCIKGECAVGIEIETDATNRTHTNLLISAPLVTMRSALVFAVIATSSVLALPSARSNPSFVGFPDVLPCSNGDGVTSTTSEAAAAAAIAAGDQALLIGKGVECSGIVGQEYRV